MQEVAETIHVTSEISGAESDSGQVAVSFQPNHQYKLRKRKQVKLQGQQLGSSQEDLTSGLDDSGRFQKNPETTHGRWSSVNLENSGDAGQWPGQSHFQQDRVKMLEDLKEAVVHELQDEILQPLATQLREQSKVLQGLRDCMQGLVGQAGQPGNAAQRIQVAQPTSGMDEVDLTGSQWVTDRPMRVSLQPPKYDGTSDWDGFLIKFESCAKMAKWDATTKCRMLGNCLEKMAYQFYTNLNASERSSYEFVEAALQKRFGDSPAEIYRAKLNARTRKHNESVKELRDDLWRLVCKGYPEMPYEARETLTLQFLLNTLDVNARLHLVSRGTQSLDMAVHTLVQYEAIIEMDKKKSKKSKDKEPLDVLAVKTQSSSPQGASSASVDPDKASQNGAADVTSSTDVLKAMHQTMLNLLEVNQQCLKAFSHKKGNGKNPIKSSGTTSEGPPSKGACYVCGATDHWANKCPQRQNKQGNCPAPDRS